MRCRVLVGLLFLTLTPSAGAEEHDRGVKIYTGAIHFNWDTEGEPGHTIDCRTEQCDDDDFNRSNLDSSMGFRAGAEWPLLHRKRFRLRAGVEGSLRFTDYDQSQRELRLLDVVGLVGTGVDLGPVTPWVRVGLGGLISDDGRARAMGFGEVALDIDVGPDTALRLAGRWNERNGPDDNDTSLVLVTGGNTSTRSPPTRWTVDSTAGVSVPGGLVGEHLELKRGPFWQMSAFRRMGAGGHRLGLALDMMRAESTERRDFNTIPGNERTEEMLGVAGIWDVRVARSDRFRLRLGAGVKVSDWEDDFDLLIDENGNRVTGDPDELGWLAKLEALINPDARFPLLLGIEQVYWPDIDLGELRIRVGMEIGL